MPSVPVQSMKNERNRVQEKEKSHLYPTKKKGGGGAKLEEQISKFSQRN